MIRGERTFVMAFGFAGLTSFVASMCFSAWFHGDFLVAVAGGVVSFVVALGLYAYVVAKMGN